MVVRTYLDRNNTIIYNDNTNTGRNPITELFYGGTVGETQYSRLLFHFDESRLKDLYTGGTYADLTKLTHTLRMTNTGAFDTDLLGTTTCGEKERACSFDLILFAIDQDWDEGVGYDYGECTFIGGQSSTSVCPSNWVQAQTNVSWSGGNGTYSGSPTILQTQHFERGNENIEMDITSIVNGYLTGGTNYGLGIAYTAALEATPTTELKYVGFYTRHTQTAFEPHVETIYNCPIQDSRADFYMDKSNKVYLYVNLGGTPTNLDSNPSVVITDSDDVVYTSITSSAVTHVTKGVYCVDLNIPSSYSGAGDCLQWTDTWSGLTIGGVSRPDAVLDIILKDGGGYYNIGDSDGLPKKYGFGVSGIKRDERIHRGDIRKVLVSARIPYTVNQSQVIDSMEYRIYVKEGRGEYTIIDFQTIDMAFNHNYFLLDTQSLIPNTYYLDIKLTSNQEVTTVKDVISFDIVSQAELR
jgi:hypothetical protein